MSSGADLLTSPNHTAKCAFRNCGPVLWNDLPADLRSIISVFTFKSRLKTLFTFIDLHCMCLCVRVRLNLMFL